MELNNIAILGPRGNVGTAIINELLKDGTRFSITGISREHSPYQPLSDSGIVAKNIDYESLSALTEAFNGQDAVVNCTTGGSTQYDASKLIINAAVAAGVKFYFANEYVGNIHREEYRRLPEAFVGAKIRVREYLEELGRNGKIQWTALNGGPFFDMWLMKGPAGFNVRDRRARIYGSGNTPLHWTPLPTIALAAANMLRNPAPIANRAIHISTVPGLSQNVILSTLESILGGKFAVEHVDIDKIHNNALIALERGELGKAMKGLTVGHQFYEGQRGSVDGVTIDNELVGVHSVSVEDAIKQAIELYGKEFPIVEGMYFVEACEI
ncbi:hypothetical protein BCR34DRAFT_505989 [Clohesyomyces aquaticus]|uniref:NAD(P)-binding domain-containing protein n=1 Tax=Clohesyomyces aquaticus TaxID=1231657 RepID=A0A1Y2A3U9_9PLEO|nr:hypothetical protein BCR34DRAFT_505989 [Clohesyomyces aquaticus]